MDFPLNKKFAGTCTAIVVVGLLVSAPMAASADVVASPSPVPTASADNGSTGTVSSDSSEPTATPVATTTPTANPTPAPTATATPVAAPTATAKPGPAASKTLSTVVAKPHISAVTLAAPSNVSGSVQTQYKNNTADVYWDAVDGADSYDVTLIPSDGGASFTETASNNSLVGVHLPDTGNVGYSASVVAKAATGEVSEAGTGALSGQVSSYRADPPTNVKLTRQSVDGSTFNISWRAPTYTGGVPVTDYLVLVRDRVTQEFVVDDEVNASTFSHDFSVTPGSTYDAYIYAENSSGQRYSDSSATTFDSNPLTTPYASNVQVSTNYTRNSDNQYPFHVTWDTPTTDDSAAVTGYDVKVSGDNGYEKTYSVSGPASSYDFVLPPAHGVTFTATVITKSEIGQADPAFTTFTEPTLEASAPQNVTASNVSATGATVSWSAPADDGGYAVEGYIVQLFDSNGRQVSRSSFDSSTFSYTYSNLPQGENYTAKIIARNSFTGYGDAASTSFSLAAQVPSASTYVGVNPTGVDADGNYVYDVVWNSSNANGSAVTSYTVTINGSNGFEKTVTVGADATKASLVIPSQHDVNFVATVTANSSIGSSDPASSSIFTESVGSPTKVTGLTATATTSSVELNWNTPTDDGGVPIDHYRVDVYDADGNLVDVQFSNTTSFTEQNLLPGTDYTFVVTAVNLYNYNSNTVSVNATTLSTVPGQVQGTQLIPTGTNSVVSWSAPQSDGGSPITGYQVTLTDSPGHITVKNVSKDTLTTTFADTNMRGHSYSVAVVAVNANGESENPGVAYYSVSLGAPTAPQNVTATTVGTSVTVTWGKPVDDGGSPVTGYVVNLFTQKGIITAQVDADTTNYTFTGLPSGVTYFYQVEAVNNVGYGASSLGGDSIITTAPVDAPTAPTATQIANQNDTPFTSVNQKKETATIHYADGREGAYVYGSVDGQGLGWLQLDSSLNATWSIANLNLESGVHVFTVQGLQGKLIGKTTFTVAKTSTGSGNGGTSGGNGNGGGTTGTPVAIGSGNGGTTIIDPPHHTPVTTTAGETPTKLAWTGSDGVGVTLTIGGLLVLLGAAFARLARRRKASN